MVILENKAIKIKQLLLYCIKLQGGSPIMAVVILLLPIDSIIIKTVIANVIGAIIFYPVDMWIFRSKNGDAVK